MKSRCTFDRDVAGKQLTFIVKWTSMAICYICWYILHTPTFLQPNQAHPTSSSSIRELWGG
jgi:hypothetical protein